MSATTVYLDYAAATPVDKQVKLSMDPYFTDRFYNPSANYLAAKSVAKDIEEARLKVAYWLGSKSSEIIFTAGGTEANNLAINGIMSQYPEANLLISSIEHESIIIPAEKFRSKFVPVNNTGLVDIEKLESLIDDNTVLVSIMYANNEIGSIQPINKLSKLVNSIRKKRIKVNNNLPIYLHTDACQAANYLDLHVSSLGVDLMTINGGKIYGPKQSGVLYVNRKVSLQPQILGGGQEMGYRSGTENVANIIGLANALDIAQTNRLEERERLYSLQKTFLDKLSEIPNLQLNGGSENRLPNNINVIFKDKDNETLLMKLDELGIQCASGSACNANTDDVSHVLKAIGLNDKDIRSSLRFTMGKFTKIADLDYTINSLLKILQ